MSSRAPMLLACPACHRQYDVGSHEPGSRVRCHCGTLCTVPEARSRRAAALHCSECGGRIEPGAKACAYCQAAIALADRGFGEVCPECFALLVLGARFCSSCGTRIQPEAIPQALTEWSCPRCRAKLALRTSAAGAFSECTGCGGLWLAEELVERLSQERDRAALAALVAGVLPPSRPVAEEGPRYLACPVCQEPMHRRNFGTASGVIVDWCRGHGWWFDAHELERVLAFVEKGGLDRARAREIERQEREIERARNAAEGAKGIAGPILLAGDDDEASFLDLLTTIARRVF